MQSDKVIGMRYFDAVRYIECINLWEEVTDLVIDAYGIVVKVIHWTSGTWNQKKIKKMLDKLDQACYNKSTKGKGSSRKKV